MAKIVIVGGKLQGSEAAYLAKQADIEIVLIDKDPQAPAQHLCDSFICGDVISDSPVVNSALEAADIILPTMENDKVLRELAVLSLKKGYKLAFDWDAYEISSSKLASDRLFAKHGLPCPQYYPKGTYPYIAKPSSESGSHGVIVLHTKEEMEKFLQEEKENYIIQEFLEGPSYSIEIIGRPGNYRTYEITEIFVDDVYDCNRAAALYNLEIEKKKQIEDLAVTIAERIGLTGIMDLEVIDHHGEIKILEIDARLPSQTSIVVYHASGMNYIKELYDLFYHGDFQDAQTNRLLFTSLAHYLITEDSYECLGEHIMVEGGLLEYVHDLCSEAVVISDFCPENVVWRGTFVNWAEDYSSLMQKEQLVQNEIARIIAKET